MTLDQIMQDFCPGSIRVRPKNSTKFFWFRPWYKAEGHWYGTNVFDSSACYPCETECEIVGE